MKKKYTKKKSSDKKKNNKSSKVKSSKVKSSKVKSSKEKSLIDNKILKDPSRLRIGYMSKFINGKKYIVKLNKDKKHAFFIASKEEIDCDELLKKNMRINIAIYKRSKGKGKFKTFKNAMSYSLGQTKKVYPKCLIVNDKLNIRKENQSRLSSLYDNVKYYTKYTYYKLFKWF